MAYFPPPDEIMAISRTPTVVHFSIDSNDGTATYTIPVKAGTFVHAVCTFVSEAFTTGGANASLAIGDGSSAAGYLATTDTVLQTIDTAVTTSAAGGEAYAGGKYYSADDTIDFAFTAAASAATAGKVVGFVVMSSVRLDGIPAAAAGS
jgi:hypothetical protein